MTITGPAAGLTISGGGLSRVFQVETGVTATITGLNITGGSTSASGGGIDNSGTLTLDDSTISASTAAQDGGAIYTDGPNLTLNDCTIASNSSVGSGGGIEALGNVTVTSTTFNANQASLAVPSITPPIARYRSRIRSSLGTRPVPGPRSTAR